jgi:hypothetical protein
VVTWSAPFIVHRLGETYLLAAEALVRLGKLDSAAYYVNILKQRAANKEETMLQLQLLHPNMTIDYILDEKVAKCVEKQTVFDLKTSVNYTPVTKHNADARAGIRMPTPLVRLFLKLSSTNAPTIMARTLTIKFL